MEAILKDDDITLDSDSNDEICKIDQADPLRATMDEFHSIDFAIYERHERDRLERMALNKAGMLELEALLNDRDSELQQFDPFKRYSELKSQVCPKLWLL